MPLLFLILRVFASVVLLLAAVALLFRSYIAIFHPLGMQVWWLGNHGVICVTGSRALNIVSLPASIALIYLAYLLVFT